MFIFLLQCCCTFFIKFTIGGTLEHTTVKIEIHNNTRRRINLRFVESFCWDDIIFAPAPMKVSIINQVPLVLKPKEEVKVYKRLKGRPSPGGIWMDMSRFIKILYKRKGVDYQTSLFISPIIIGSGEVVHSYTTSSKPLMRIKVCSDNKLMVLDGPRQINLVL